MKRFTVLLLLATIAAISCQKFDDSQIWKELNDHKNRIVLLEELCRKLNTDIINLQTIVTALETNDYIISASPLVTGDGYTFLFKSGKSIVIYNGKDGSNGKDGAAPQVGVKKDTDGIYYWTINGEWLIVDGKKVKASATDGSNGENGTNGIDGTDGITPQFKIEEGYWYVSYDNCVSWEMLGKAIGDNGLNGANGDSFFKGVEIKDGFVIFMLNDGKDSTIKIPLQKDTVLEISLQDSERLRAVISSEEMRTVTKLKVKGVISDEDMRFLQHFISLEELDLSETTFCEGVFYLNPYENAVLNRTLRKVLLPVIDGHVYYSNCLNLQHVVINQDDIYWGSTTQGDMSFCPMLETLEYAEGVKSISSEECITYKDGSKLYEYIVESKYTNVILPSTTEKVYHLFLRYESIGLYSHYMRNYVVTCKALTPPTITGITSGSSHKQTYENCTLYVPSESVKLYKEHSIWGQFNVLPIVK